MSDKRYEANIIRATAVEPANNLESTSAPGVWSIDEVVELQKKSKWPTVGNVVTNVDSLFSTFLYDGNGANQVIENGIKLGNANDGGSLKGGTGTWINVPSSSDFGFGTGDFTIECFFFMNAKKNYNSIIDFRTTSQSNDLPVIYVDNTPNLVYFTTSARISGSIAEGQWYHIAVSRSGTSTKMFLNGTQLGSTFTDNTNYATPSAVWSLGAAGPQTTYEIDGFLSNVRIIKGTALYTSNFTAPTSALTAVTNTKLLTLQGDAPFVDNSGNSVALTQNGSPIASEFGPFTGTGGEGGLTWIKNRDTSYGHNLTDTARGGGYYLESQNNGAQPASSQTNNITSFNSNGFSIGNRSDISENGSSHVSWTFRKQAKFFDIVTWTGNGVAGRQITHNLGSAPGMVIVKATDVADSWYVFHRSLGGTKFLELNTTSASATSTNVWQDTAPSSTVFTVAGANTNTDTKNYVAYLFAHNNNDGGFGPDQDGDIIKCDSYTGGNTGLEINVGFEPQFVMIKRASGTGDWMVFDAIRGVSNAVSAPLDNTLFWNNANVERTNTGYIGFTSTGFVQQGGSGDTNTSGETYIYMAIRRSQAVPTAASQVFAIDTYDATPLPSFKSSFVTDFALYKNTTSVQDWKAVTRQLGATRLVTNATTAETGEGDVTWDYMNGWYSNSGTYTNIYSWMWARARGYFDVVATKAVSTNNGDVNHNLGVKPEMAWYKRRDGTDAWYVVSSVSEGYLRLDLNNAASGTGHWIDGTGGAIGGNNATATTINSGYKLVGNASYDMVIYLFATVAGVSKVGSYTGNGSSQNIDCGFSSGARFVLIKSSTQATEWNVFDTTRGIVSGNDPVLFLDSTAAQVTNGDFIDPHSSGFTINYVASLQGCNTDGQSYIFYAIAT